MQQPNHHAHKKKGVPKIIYILLAFSVSVIWGYGFIAMEVGLDAGVGEFILLGVRFLIAGLALLIFRFILQKKQGAKKPFTKKEWFLGSIVGLINFVGFFLQTLGQGMLDPGRCAMYTGAYVVLVSVCSCFLNKKFSAMAIVNSVVFFAGVVMISRPAGSGFGLGDVLAMGCSVFFAAHILIVDRIGGIDALNFNVAQMLAMGVFGVIGALFTGETASIVRVWDVNVLLHLLFLALFSSAYAYMVQMLVKKKLSASLVAIFFSLESVTGAIFGFALGETQFSLWLLAGCLVMTAASISASLTDQKNVVPNLERHAVQGGTKMEEQKSQEKGEKL
jgi:drug/metabolite transporter (DMT)-like permease